MAGTLNQLEQSDVPEYVKEAARIFSAEELESLTAFFDDDTQEFVGLGYTNVDGKMTRYADVARSSALDVLDAYYRQEHMKHIAAIQSTVRNSIWRG